MATIWSMARKKHIKKIEGPQMLNLPTMEQRRVKEDLIVVYMIPKAIEKVDRDDLLIQGTRNLKEFIEDN